MNEPASTPRCRIVVAGSSLESLVRGKEGFGNYAEIVAAYPSLESWSPGDAPDADLLVVSCPSLFPQTIDSIRSRLAETGAGRAVVVYEFANAETEAAAREPANQITTMRAPITATELRAACEAHIALAAIRDHWAESGEALRAAEPESDPAGAPPAAGDEPVRERRFSDAQLARIARISTAIECECPHHLAALLNSLNAFEDYSRHCENRNEQDAILHHYLYRSTAKARAMMEDALDVLVEAEGIEID